MNSKQFDLTGSKSWESYEAAESLWCRLRRGDYPCDRAVHVVNVPSSAATASIVIGQEIVKMAAEAASL